MSAEREHVPDTESAHPAGTTATIVAPELGNESRSQGTASAAPPERNAVTVVPVPAQAAVSGALGRRASATERAAVHVAPNIRELATAGPSATSEEVAAERERRDLNEIVHGVLIVGLVISTTLMLLGLGLDLVYQRELPATVPDVGDVIGRVLALRPSGFLALGLLVLIATPILRVVGSIGAFLYEHDWRFASLTTLVLAVLVVSLLLGHG